MKLLNQSIVVGMTLLLVGFASCTPPASSNPSSDTSTESSSTEAVDSEHAPPFTLATLDGASLSLSDYEGQVRLLDFWAIWCKPCVAELPILQGLQEKYGSEGLQVIGMYFSDEDVEAVQNFLDERNVTYPNVLATDEVGESYGGIYGLPVAFLLDGEGKILWKHGGEKDPEELEARIREALGVS